MEDSKPNDIDIAVIFNRISINEQLNQSQQIKKQLQEISEFPIHIKSFDLYAFFDSANFAKENILFYGKSLLSGDFFSKKLGLDPKIQIYYSLNDLKKKDKVRFNYMLNGRKGEYGLLRKFNGKLLKPGLIEIDPIYENIFISSIKKITQNYRVKRILF